MKMIKSLNFKFFLGLVGLSVVIGMAILIYLVGRLTKLLYLIEY